MFLTKLRADGDMDRSPYGQFWFEPVSARSATGLRVTPATALGLTAVYACVRVKAESFASLRFSLYQPKVGGGRNRVTNHWLYRLIARAPNRFQNPFEWAAMLEGHLTLRGNAYCQITANGAGEIIELLPLHPDRMKVEILNNGSYRYNYTDQTGKSIYYQRGEIWHLRGLSSDGYVGMSPIEVAREAIAEGLSMQSYSSRFFANDTKPGGGWIEYPGAFQNQAVKQTFRDSWQQMQGGANRGKVAVLERGMKYHELGLNNKDAQFVEARAAKGKEIAQLFRIPPHKIGILDEATFSNIEQQNIEFWLDSMTPEAKLWQSSIVFSLLGPDTDLEPEFDIREMMRGDGAARATRISTLVNAGVMTRNEGRGEEGYDPIDGLDEPLRPLNMVEESAVADEIIEADGGADDETPEEADGAGARLASLLTANAARAARRIAAGQTPNAQTLAEMLAITETAAYAWLALDHSGMSEADLTASLSDLALKGTP